MKVLVIHASAGAGHTKAAEALCAAIKRSGVHDVTIIDALDYTSPFFKKMYSGSYHFMISKIPKFWGACFNLLDVPFLQPLIRCMRRLYNKANAGKLHQYLKKGRFDYVFMTHFMPTEVSAALKRAGKITSHLVTVITDYDVHKIWLADGISHYCVASGWTLEKMARLGVERSKVVVTGIPTDERFFQGADVMALKKKLGLRENIFTVLVATGSFGIGPIEAIINVLTEFQVLVVCGHNKALYQRLSGNINKLVKVFGHVDNMHELMAVSDAMVTKPGGLSISEALVSQLPMVFFNAIPGQETGNVKVLKSYGIGISGRTVPQIGEELVHMRFSRDLFLTNLKRTKMLACPNAARDIVALIK